MMRPRFTVIVPSYARPDRLLVCLRAVDALSYDGYDVVVSDDGSPDPLEPLVARERWQHDVGVVRGPNRGSGAARNRAAAEALGSRLAFTADDCAPAVDWLQRHEAAFNRPGLGSALIGGSIRHARSQDLCATASHLLIDYLTLVFNREQPQFFTPNNLAVDAQAFADSGGFDDTIGATGEDREFCARWLKQGRTIGFAPDAVVSHDHPLTFAGYLRQQAAYGRGSERSRARVERGSRPGVPMPLGFYLRLVLHPFRAEPVTRAVPLVGLLAAGQVANTWGVLRERGRRER